MKDEEISTPDELEAALLKNSLIRRERLWKTAEGSKIRFTELLALFVGSVSACYGLYGVVVDKNIDAIMLIAIGGIAIVSTVVRRQHSQIAALRELLKDAVHNS